MPAAWNYTRVCLKAVCVDCRKKRKKRYYEISHTLRIEIILLKVNHFLVSFKSLNYSISMYFSQTFLFVINSILVEYFNESQFILLFNRNDKKFLLFIDKQILFFIDVLKEMCSFISSHVNVRS